MKKYYKLILILLFSVTTLGQNKYSLQISQNKLFVTEKYNENGIQLSIPNSFTFYCLGERKVLGIVELDSKLDFDVKKILLFKRFQNQLEENFKLQKKSTADTSLFYEIQDEPQLNICRVIYFYYDSYYVTNIIGDVGWSSINDGFHNVIITSEAIAIYNFTIQVRNGELIK
jgi:hypothetical protein